MCIKCTRLKSKSKGGFNISISCVLVAEYGFNNNNNKSPWATQGRGTFFRSIFFRRLHGQKSKKRVVKSVCTQTRDVVLRQGCTACRNNTSRQESVQRQTTCACKTFGLLSHYQTVHVASLSWFALKHEQSTVTKV